MHKITTALLMLTWCMGCNPTQTSLIPPVSDGKATYEQFVQKNSFPHTISEQRKMLILDKYNKLQIGMTKQDVSSLIGDPDFSTYLYTKEYPGEYLGTHWTYYFKKINPNLTNLKLDLSVNVFFDTADKAHWIVADNIESLAEKKVPRPEGPKR